MLVKELKKKKEKIEGASQGPNVPITTKIPLQIVISQKNELDCISMISPQYENTILAKWHKQIIKIQAEPNYEQKFKQNIFITASQTCTDYKREGGCEHCLLGCRFIERRVSHLLVNTYFGGK